MTKQEALNLFNGLNSMGELKGTKFAYGVTKNLAALKGEVEAIQKAGAAQEALRIKLLTEASDKDEEGNAITKDNQFQIEPTKLVTVLKLLSESPETIEYQEFMKSESDFQPFMIKLTDLPEVSVSQMFTLKPLIEE